MNLTARTTNISSASTVLILATIAIAVVAFSVPSVKGSTQSSSSSVLTVWTWSTTGQSLNGYFVTVWQNGQAVASGFSPINFNLASGETYTVTVDNFGPCRFEYFIGAGYTDSYTVTMSGTGTTAVAEYNCLTTNVTLQAVDQSGRPLNGYYMSLWQNGMLMAASYSTATETIFTNQMYSAVAESYGSCTFSHWQGGSSNPLTFTASGQGQTFTAVYECG